jgi:hypothetical protein
VRNERSIDGKGGAVWLVNAAGTAISYGGRDACDKIGPASERADVIDGRDTRRGGIHKATHELRQAGVRKLHPVRKVQRLQLRERSQVCQASVR